MKYFLSILILSALLMFQGVVSFAQDENIPFLPTMEAMQAQIQKSAEQADTAAKDAVEISERAEKTMELVLNLFNIFEAIGVLIAVGGTIIGVVGLVGGGAYLRRASKAANELREARASLEAELTSLRQNIDKELEQLRHDVRQSIFDQGQATSNSFRAQSLLELGDRQYRVHDLRGSLNSYLRSHALDTQNATTNYRIGYLYSQIGEFKKAKKYFSNALKVEDDFAPALAGLGLVVRKLAEKMPEGNERELMMGQSQQHLLNALSQSPRLLDEDGESWWGALGGLYRRQGQVDKAIDAYSRAAEVTPHSSYGPGNLALLYMEKGDKDAMLKTFETVERLAWAESQTETSNYWGYADVLVARLALGKGNEAEEVLETTLKLSNAQYQLDMLVDTLTRLSSVVEGRRVSAITKSIEQIRAYTPASPIIKEGKKSE